MGTCYLQNKAPKPEFAKAYIEEAISGFELQSEVSLYLKSKHKLALCFIQLENFAKAQKVLNEVERLAKGSYPTIHLYNRFHQAQLAGALGQNEKAVLILQQILADLPANFTHFETQVYSILAINYQAIGEWEHCLEYAQCGIEMLGRLKNKLTSPSSEVNLNQSFYQLYDLALESCYALKNVEPAYAERAFALSEQFKSRVLKKTRTLLDRNVPEQDTILALQAELADLESEEYLLSKEIEPGQEEQPGLKSEILSKENRLLSLKDQNNPTANLEIGLNKIRQKLSNDETLLKYHWGEHHTFAFILNLDTFRFEKLEDNQPVLASIQRLFQRCRNPLEFNFDESQEQTINLFLADARFLYDQLILPFQDDLKEHLLVVPDGPLSLLPFELLLKDTYPLQNNFKTTPVPDF